MTPIDFSHFDVRKYETLPVPQAYGEWVETYEQTVQDAMDLRLLERLAIDWPATRSAVDLACGTGRIGVWLRSRGVGDIDGVDITPEMLERARAKDVYRRLERADVTETNLPASTYDLAIQVLADEHLPDLAPLYREAARLTGERGRFVMVGYHPYFLMNGVPTHYDRPSGQSVAIASYVHLFSDHVKAAQDSGWRLAEMEEGLVDDTLIAVKPSWEKYRHWPLSYLALWAKAIG